jgi:hypothetical protein
MVVNYKNLIESAVEKNPPSVRDLKKSPGIKSDFDLIEKYNDRISPSDLRPASVVVGIIEREKPYIFLTKRSANLEQHSGQIAFPGGKVEDGETFTEAAFREAKEEVGLDSSMKQVQVIEFYLLLVLWTLNLFLKLMKGR